MDCIYYIVFGYLFLYILLLYGLVSIYDLILSFLFSVCLVTSFLYVCSCCIYCLVFVKFIGAE